jgi:hypothetical protein
MERTKPGGDEDLNRLADELVAMVPELLLKLTVHQHDDPVTVDHQHPARRGFDGEAERLFW